MSTHRLVVASLLILGLLGCSGSSSSSVSVDDGKGNKIVVNGNDGKTSVDITAENGEKVTMRSSPDAANTVVIDKNGDKSTMTTDKNGSVKVTTQEGSASVGGSTNVSEGELGLAFYPGSTEVAGRAFKFEGPKEKSYSSVRTTADAPDKVIEFYKDKVKDAAIATVQNMSVLNGKLDNGASVSIAAENKNGKTEVTVTTSKKSS